MASKPKSDPLAWFKVASGSFILEMNGLSNTHAGIYIRLLCLYWSSLNTIEMPEKQLQRMVSVTKEEEQALKDVLDEFFPINSEGKRSHAGLDSQMNAIKSFSALQSERGKRAHATNKPELSILEEDGQFQRDILINHR